MQDSDEKSVVKDYERIRRAIEFLRARVTSQPSLDEVAAHVHLSRFHFQRLFSRWAGTTPKRFQQALTLELGKSLLDGDATLLHAADSLGLSSTSRLHDHFVQLEAVTPGEYKSKGQGLVIGYDVADTPVGRLFAAATPRGICRAAFLDDEQDPAEELAGLRSIWPLAVLRRDADAATRISKHIGFSGAAGTSPLSLHVRGTNFQVAVWRALLRIPPGHAVSYAAVAAAVGRPNAVRAAGRAVGANPVAFMIPCHRVIRQSGALGGYRWGVTRKEVILTWERLRSGPTDVDAACDVV